MEGLEWIECTVAERRWLRPRPERLLQSQTEIFKCRNLFRSVLTSLSLRDGASKALYIFNMPAKPVPCVISHGFESFISGNRGDF